MPPRTRKTAAPKPVNQEENNVSDELNIEADDVTVEEETPKRARKPRVYDPLTEAVRRNQRAQKSLAEAQRRYDKYGDTSKALEVAQAEAEAAKTGLAELLS